MEWGRTKVPFLHECKVRPWLSWKFTSGTQGHRYPDPVQGASWVNGPQCGGCISCSNAMFAALLAEEWTTLYVDMNTTQFSIYQNWLLLGVFDKPLFKSNNWFHIFFFFLLQFSVFFSMTTRILCLPAFGSQLMYACTASHKTRNDVTWAIFTNRIQGRTANTACHECEISLLLRDHIGTCNYHSHSVRNRKWIK